MLIAKLNLLRKRGELRCYKSFAGAKKHFPRFLGQKERGAGFFATKTIS